MSKLVNRLVGKTTLSKEILENRKKERENVANEQKLLREAREEARNSHPLDEALEGDLSKLVKKLSLSSPNDLKSAAKAAKEMGDDLGNPQSERPIWKAMAVLLKTAAK